MLYLKINISSNDLFLCMYACMQYHGGTNFGHTSGGPYITTSYDYDAPLDEYGNLNQPKWGHLQQLHHLLTSMEKTLLYGVRRDVDYGNKMTVSITLYIVIFDCAYKILASSTY